MTATKTKNFPYAHLSILMMLGLLASCAHHRDVRPGVDGVHRVLIKTADGDAGAQEAIEQANHYCKKHNKEAAFITEQKNYVGDMDEKDYKAAKKATTVAKTIGGFGYALGGKKESNAGGLIGMGGVVGDQVLGQGYSVEMKFRCQ
jgi:hypothetical protein